MESVFLEEISESYFSLSLPPSLPPSFTLSSTINPLVRTQDGSYLQQEGPTQELDLLALILDVQPTEWREDKCVLFKPLIYSVLSLQPRQTKTDSKMTQVRKGPVVGRGKGGRSRFFQP